MADRYFLLQVRVVLDSEEGVERLLHRLAEACTNESEVVSARGTVAETSPDGARAAVAGMLNEATQAHIMGAKTTVAEHEGTMTQAEFEVLAEEVRARLFTGSEVADANLN